MSSNHLVSSTKASDSGLHAALHPLVLLTISDYITRHTLRKLTTPIVGALIGQQNGREITIEHAYDVKLVAQKDDDDGQEQWCLNDEWFEERLQQYKDVHKAPALDLVGWWTVSPSSGPGLEVMQIHHQVMKHNESSLLLSFHPEAILFGTATGGKLPLTIYESVHENVTGADAGGGEAMQVEGEEAVGEKLEIRLKEIRYEIATGEAEMISVDFVARGGGNATAIESAVNPHAVHPPQDKGKGKQNENTENSVEDLNLNSEEEELISFLTSRANAIKMLGARISLLKQHLDDLPPSYINTSEPPRASPKIDHSILRAILALVTKLPLVVPLDTEAFKHNQATEQTDVALVRLMGDIGRSIQNAKELGGKFSVAENNKRTDRSYASMGNGGWADSETGLDMDSNFENDY